MAHIERWSQPPDYDAAVLSAFRDDPQKYLRSHEYGIIGHLEEVLADTAHQKAMLDVGCAFGAVVRSAQQRGWRATGIDTDQARIEEGSKHTSGLKTADLTNHGITLESLDAVTMWHVLEHIPRPDQALAHVRELLRPGGYLFLEVPNLASPIAWLIYRRRWLGFETPGHLFAFTKSTLSSLIEDAGFELIRVTRPAIAEVFPGGLKGTVRQFLFGALHQLDQGDAIRILARKP